MASSVKVILCLAVISICLLEVFGSHEGVKAAPVAGKVAPVAGKAAPVAGKVAPVAGVVAAKKTDHSVRHKEGHHEKHDVESRKLRDWLPVAHEALKVLSKDKEVPKGKCNGKKQ